jgi:hypothetical protein
MIRIPLLLIASLTGLLTISRPPVLPDEGMWTFANPPLALLAERYGFTPDQAWFDHLRQSSVRFNSGGSGSFIGRRGLVLTNHHVALESIQKLSSEERDLVANGFYAHVPADELRCKDLELNVLMSMEDVTEVVNNAEAAHLAMRAIENDENARTGLRCNVESLYQGGVYMLYRYRQFTDVRLVWAPELAVGFYGGDPDNFTYPRFNLDAAIFRVWEDGKPIESPAWLEWSIGGPANGDLVFVSGNPGSTNRLITLAQVKTFRDVIYPRVLAVFQARRAALVDYSEQGAEQARRAKDELFSIENTLKAIGGELASLQDESIMRRKADAEEAFLLTDAGSRVRSAMQRIADAQEGFGNAWPVLFYSNLPGRLCEIAEQLGDYVDAPADNAAARTTAELALFSSAPVYPDLEEALLRSSFRAALEGLGEDHPLVRAMLDGHTPEERTAALVRGTKLGDVEVRRSLAKGGREALEAAGDPILALVARVNVAVADTMQTVGPLQAITRAESQRIAEARFDAYGRGIYPDANFTLRLSLGVVKGYEEGTRDIPYKTTFGGLFDRHDSFDGAPPYHLPERMLAARSRIDPSTPLNFVCTADIIGGNSGSPVVNRQGQLVGLIFDGNIASLGNRFVYDERQARAVAVHSSAILEALRKVYDAEPLVREILGG